MATAVPVTGVPVGAPVPMQVEGQQPMVPIEVQSSAARRRRWGLIIFAITVLGFAAMGIDRMRGAPITTCNGTECNYM